LGFLLSTGIWPRTAFDGSKTEDSKPAGLTLAVDAMNNRFVPAMTAIGFTY